MRAHLTAAHFVNESSPVIDSFPLHLAIVERHCSLHRVLCSSHPWRGSVAHNASNFLQSAPRYAYLSSDVLPRKNFPLSSVSATRSRVRLQTRFLKPCPLLWCLGEPTAPSRPGPLSPTCEAKRVKIFVPSTCAWEGNLEHMQTNIHATSLSKCKLSLLLLQGYITSHAPKCKYTTGSILILEINNNVYPIRLLLSYCWWKLFIVERYNNRYRRLGLGNISALYSDQQLQFRNNYKEAVSSAFFAGISSNKKCTTWQNVTI